ncbi:hypothetical protein ACHAPZ_002168 [Fusarium culmorum]
MATGIAVVDNWVSVPDPRIATQQPYYSNYSAPIRYHQLYSPAGVVWETEILSSWSEWSCDHDGPCCGCDCDCRSEKKDNDSGDRYERGIQNKRGAHGAANLQDHRVNHEPSQRHLNDAQRRIKDWVTVMPGLVKNNMAPATTQKTEKCGCKNCKEERKRERRSAGKETKHRSKQEEEKKKRRKSRR